MWWKNTDEVQVIVINICTPLHPFPFLFHTLYCFCETLCQFFLSQHPKTPHNCSKNITVTGFYYFHSPLHLILSNKQASSLEQWSPDVQPC